MSSLLMVIVLSRLSGFLLLKNKNKIFLLSAAPVLNITVNQESI